MKKYLSSDNLYFLLIGFFCSSAISLMLFASLAIPISPWALPFLCAVFTAFFFVMFQNRKSFLACLAGLGAALLIGFIIFSSVHLSGGLSQFLREIILFIQEEIEYKPAFGVPIVGGLTFLICLAAALSLRKNVELYVLGGIGFLYLLWNMYMNSVVFTAANESLVFSMPGLLIFVVCFVIMLAGKLNLFAQNQQAGQTKQAAAARQKTNFGRKAVFALAFIPVCLVVVSLAYVMPKPPAQADVREICEVCHQWPCVCPITPPPAEDMKVTARERVYLAREMSWKYLGNAWDNPGENRSLGYGASFGSIMPTAAFRNNASASGAFLEEKTLTITALQKMYPQLFLPPLTNTLEFPGGKLVQLYSGSYGGFTVDPQTTDSNLDKGTSYRLSYISVDWSERFLVMALQNASTRYEEELGAQLKDYLQLPDTLPQRVRNLAEQLTRNQDNAYDKLVTLIQYLRANSKYDGDLLLVFDQTKADAVDDFLFGGKVGNALHFSSALAVMGRCVGIPTRLVEGLFVPYDSPYPDFEMEYVFDTSEGSHFWVEAYFPGFGWVPFEPTTGFYISHPDEYKDVPSKGECPDCGEDPCVCPECPICHQDPCVCPCPVCGEYPCICPEPCPICGENPCVCPKPCPICGKLPPCDCIGEGENPPDPQDPDEPGFLPPFPPDPPRPNNSTPGGLSAGVKALLTTVGVILFFAFVAGAVCFYFSRNYNKKLETLAALSNKNASTAYFLRLKKAADAYGLPMRDNETSLAYASRVGKNLNFSGSGTALSDVAAIFSKAIFSQEDVSENELVTMKRCYNEMVANLRGKMKRLSF
ncbi:MAG: hypothetical protein FWD39_00625, partial [Clostridiales bacterium]|nr:hypothetical protein [Clostridiales bacterium]